MITAQEALKLPTAKLNEADRKILQELEDGMDKTLREGFDGAATKITIPIGGISNRILAKFARRARKHGWAFVPEAVQEKNPITGQAQVVAVNLLMEPLFTIEEPE